MNSWFHNNLDWLLPACIGLGGISAITWASLSPRCGIWGNVISRGPADSSHRIALTFDDGPTAGGTDRLLDALGELGVPAAFFVVGANVRRWPDLVRRMHEEGHLVGNHSFDHSHLGFFRGRRYWQRQVDRTDAEIEAVIGRRPALFRPPMGVKTWYVTGAARRAGQTVVTWSRRGFDGINTTPQRIARRIGPRAQAGEIVLLHDGVEPHSRRDPAVTVAALRPIIRNLRERGLQLVRLDELIGVEPYAPVMAAAV
jgi:peptidoglycan/xylan/chitin deacetylase (PgdA/CDA1 family)